jgi:Skp family chaperone for outer membrane proteins
MKTLLASAAIAASVIAPVAAQAQAIPAAVVAVVDLQRVTADCTACKTAQTALQAQITALQSREKSLSTPLETEQKSIQTAVNALNGKEPDAALTARIKSWQAKRDQGSQEIAAGQQQIQRNQQYIEKQIVDKLNPIYSQVMQKRGANILVEAGTTLATNQSVDVTADILTSLNASLPTIIVTAPAPPKPATPQGR